VPNPAAIHKIGARRISALSISAYCIKKRSDPHGRKPDPKPDDVGDEGADNDQRKTCDSDRRHAQHDRNGHCASLPPRRERFSVAHSSHVFSATSLAKARSRCRDSTGRGSTDRLSADLILRRFGSVRWKEPKGMAGFQTVLHRCLKSRGSP